MRTGLIISVLLHIALLIWALGYYTRDEDPKPLAANTPVPVDIVMPPSDTTKVKAGDKKAADRKKTATPPKPKKQPAPKKTAAKPEPKKAVKEAAKPKPKPAPTKTPEPKPVKKAETPKPAKKVEAPKPKAVPKPQPKATPKPAPKQPEKPKSDFDPENIAALLNKVPDKEAGPQSRPTPVQPPQADRQEQPSYGRDYGADQQMTINEIDAFKAQVSQCWRPPTGGLGTNSISVKLRIQFKENGTLANPPQLLNSSDSPFFQPAAEAAQRAVWQCQPYRMPAEKFATWRDMILNFDPREMYGG